MSEGAKGDPGPTDFSVVIPTYNRAGHIAPCLAPFLEPEARGIEVILVDDGSTDDSEAVAQRVAASSRGAEIRCLRQPNGGPGRARNSGVEAATRDWIVFLDVDDRWFPWTVRHVRAVLAEAGDKAAMLFLRTATFADEAELADVADAPLAFELLPDIATFANHPDIAVMGTWGTCNAAVRRSLIVEAGGFEESLRCAEDVDLFFRLGASGPVGMVTAPVMVGYRTSSVDSLSGDRGRLIEGINFVTDGLKAGRYPDATGRLAAMNERRRLLVARIAFAEGDMGDAYRLILSNPGFVARQWGAGTWVRTSLTPLLALVRPQTYRFDWKRWRNG